MTHHKKRTKRIAVWWIFPCKATSGIFRELSEMDFEIDIYLFHGMSDARAKLGWYMPDYGLARVTLLPSLIDERRSTLNDIPFADYDLHLLNGYYGSWGIKEVAARLIRHGLPYGVMTEAPFNAFRGPKRLLKYGYQGFLVPIRGGRVARNARFVCSLSGSHTKNVRWLRWFGFDRNRIFPFGYFSEEPRLVKTKIEEIGIPPILVCTGYLTKAKGQSLLLRALTELKRSGIDFSCKITGYGPEKERLEKTIHEKELSNQVELRGVLEKEELWRLQATADIFVAPGYEEPWGIRINEALQSGCPVVVSNRIGASEMVVASGAGVLFEAGSVVSLTSRLKELLTDHTKLIDMKRKAADYRERISPRVAASYLRSVIMNSLDGAPAPSKPFWLLDSSKDDSV